MTAESATTTYYIPECVEVAVGSVRRVLVEAGLKITGELDMAGQAAQPAPGGYAGV